MAKQEHTLSARGRNTLTNLGEALSDHTPMLYGRPDFSGKRTKAERKLALLHALDVAKHNLRETYREMKRQPMLG